MKILLVDDDPYLIAALEALCIALGLIVIRASNGEKGLEALAENPDIVLTDINMPLMDGIQMIREIKARGINTPIIIMTSHEQDGITDIVKKYHCPIVYKPFTITTLQGVLKKVGYEGRLFGG